MGVHDGHRERLRSSFLEHGLETMNEINALELLLFYAIPRRDTNEIAHALLERFGSLYEVFQASEQSLCAVPGVGRNAAALIRLIPQIMRKSYLGRAERTVQIANSHDAGDFFLPRFLFEEDEVAYIACLDSQKRVICCLEQGRGVVNSVSLSARKIVEDALKHKAVAVVLAHNHPDGIAMPSVEDDYVTKQIQLALNTVGIRLDDHIIVAGEDYISYRDSGMLRF